MKRQFKTDLVAKHIRGTELWELVEPLQYSDIIVPVGFKTNLASIPKALRGIIDDDDPDLIDGAVVHDWLYTNATLPRADCDKILMQACLELGCSSTKAHEIYAAVRIGGAGHYGKQTDN